jgi:DNA-binding transcriptional LysR family regulator
MLNLTLRRLEVFVTVAETGGFAAAATRLGIAQPSVSSHVQALEAKAGGFLFDRPRGRKPTLTPLGNTFLTHARQLLAEATELTTDLDRKRKAAPQRIAFACQRSLANYVFTSVLADFARHHPATEVQVRIGMQEEVTAQVEQGLVDLGCLLSNEEPPNLASVVIGRQRLVFIAAPDHPLAKLERVSPALLNEHSFVGPPPASLFGQQVNGLLRNVGINEMRTVFQATEYQFIRELVIAGVGIACSALTSVERDVTTGTLAVLRVDAPPLTLDIRQIFSRRRRLSPAVKTFADYLRDHCTSADIFHDVTRIA